MLHNASFLPSRLWSLLSAGLLLTGSLTTSASVLWSLPGPVMVGNTGLGEDILHGAIKPQDSNSSSTLYFRFRVDPVADSVIKAIGDFEAGFMLVDKGVAHLGMGNAFSAWAYCAWPVPKLPKGYADLNTANPEPGKSWEYMRAGVPRYIAFKIQYVPGHDAHVTAWLNPDLSLGATELSQPTNIVTEFEADATFDEIHLIHNGGKGGWKFSQMVAGTSFEDLRVTYFWQQRWFLFSASGTMLVLVVGVVQLLERRRARRQIQKLEREHVVAAERARIARDIHDELGASLTKIHKLAAVWEQQNPALNCQKSPAGTILNTARDTIRSMDEIVWAVNPRNDTLNEMADYMVYYAEDFLRSTGIACTLDVPFQLPKLPVTAEERHNLFMAVKEALNNAVKHAAATQIRFALSFDSNLLTIEIQDNGRGFDPAAPQPAGNGLTNMQKRLSTIGGTFTLAGGPGQGTTIKLQVVLSERNSLS